MLSRILSTSQTNGNERMRLSLEKGCSSMEGCNVDGMLLIFHHLRFKGLYSIQATLA